MNQTTEFGILNINGREPSVSDKLKIHHRVLDHHHHFQTRHRIILGDARHMAAVKDESVHLVVTSPPYFDLIEYADGLRTGFAKCLRPRRGNWAMFTTTSISSGSSTRSGRSAFASSSRRSSLHRRGRHLPREAPLR
jgi:hypothetical protein